MVAVLSARARWKGIGVGVGVWNCHSRVLRLGVVSKKGERSRWCGGDGERTGCGLYPVGGSEDGGWGTDPCTTHVGVRGSWTPDGNSDGRNW